MTAEKKHARMAIYLLNRTSEEVALRCGVPGSPLDIETWIRRHGQYRPAAFARGDDLNYQLGLYKIRRPGEEKQL